MIRAVKLPKRKIRNALATVSIGALLLAIPVQGWARSTGGRERLPQSPPPFAGRIAPSYDTAKPGNRFQVRAPVGAPNVLLVLTDDVGFGAASTFGGLIPTPNLDRLASAGLRFNRFHVTAMCSPTRAALLTGRNHHAVGMGVVTEMAAEYPGYDTRFPASAATIAEVLKDNGYATAMIGKHHNANLHNPSPSGMFGDWPSGLGFEYYYGFLYGEADQFAPNLYEGTNPVDLSHKSDDYILDRDLADKAIRWIDNQAAAAPQKPFFLYYAPGSTHAPQQAPREWIAKFRGQFDAGWDVIRQRIFDNQKRLEIIPASTVLTPRPMEIPAWSSLTSRERRVFARFMEVYAAQLGFQDAQIGRVLDELRRTKQLGNTLVIFIEGDNGASMEGGPDGKVIDYGHALNGLTDSTEWAEQSLDSLGGPDSLPLYPAGWAWTMNTPFQWGKRIASHLGGTRAGMVVSWPDHLVGTGLVRSQYTHVTDVMPTILDAAGIPRPDTVNGVKQQPMNGVSFAYSFARPEASSRHKTQYYELIGNRGIYHDGWLANTTPIDPPWQVDRKPNPVLGYKWELYNLAEDFSQARDLAATYPERLRSLQDRWWREARRNNALPLDNRWMGRSSPETPPSQYVFWGKDVSAQRNAWPKMFGRSFSLAADIEMTEEHMTGVLASVGGHFAGWSFYLKDGKPTAYEAYSNKPGDQFKISAPDPLTPGSHSVSFDFAYDGGGPFRGGTMRISVDGKEAAHGRVERTINAPLPDGETFDLGRDRADSVSPDYVQSSVFDGEIRKVTVRVFDGAARP